jgi:FMN reductase
MSPLRVVAVVGTTKSVSKTRALVENIVGQLASRTEIDTEIIEIHTLNPGLGAALEREQLDTRAEAAVRKVETADLVIAATPVFRGSYTGLFKHFFDFVRQYALADKPVMPSRCCSPWCPCAAARPPSRPARLSSCWPPCS